MKIKHLAWSDPGGVDVYAHRGSTVLAPENTLEACELALWYGADVLEIDVRLSRDCHVIVIHDARVDRTCNGQGAVADMTLAELKRLDAAFHFTDPTGESCRGRSIHLATLDELFARFPDTRINIDIKDNTPEAAQAVAACIAAATRHTTVNVGSFHAATVEHFRSLAPEVTTTATQREVANLYFRRRRVLRIPYSYLQIPISYFGLPLATRPLIRRARELGINVVYWTINTPEQMVSLLDKGANGIVTDRVDIACALLGRTPERPPPQS